MGSDALQAYYARDEERDRLASGVGLLEFCRTTEVIGRTLPPPGAVIADIGGGPGRYTDWLIDAGCDGGFVHAAALSRWATRLDGMLVQHVHVRYPNALDVIDDVERTGVMPPMHDGSFNGYTHTPAQLRDEVAAAGLPVHALVNVEGIAFAFSDIAARMDDPTERMLLLDVLRAVESVPDLLGVGPHLLATARKVDA